MTTQRLGIKCKIVGEFKCGADDGTYVGNVVVEDEDMVSIGLTLTGVPDSELHRLCDMAELQVTGRVTGDGIDRKIQLETNPECLEWVMKMECAWPDAVVLDDDGTSVGCALVLIISRI